MDRLSPAQRSDNMAKVKGKDTKPEMAVRRALHALGRRFRLHRKDLPGKPDIVLPKARQVIFVHGCYWHRHDECRRATTPQTRTDFWVAKFRRTVERDESHEAKLTEAGWEVIVIWECETKDPERLRALLLRRLSRT